MSNTDGPQFDRRELYTEPAAVVPTQPIMRTAVYDERIDDGLGLRVDRVSAVAAAPVTVVPVAAAPIHAGSVQTAYSSRFAPDAVIAAAGGLAMLIMGLIAITRGGFDGPMSTPVVQVLGFNHTTSLGLIDIAIGACLLISGATSSRSGALFFGSVLGIAAFVGAVQAESFRENLALESGFAWLLVVAAIVIVASALLMPRYFTRRTVVRPM